MHGLLFFDFLITNMRRRCGVGQLWICDRKRTGNWGRGRSNFPLVSMSISESRRVVRLTSRGAARGLVTSFSFKRVEIDGSHGRQGLAHGCRPAKGRHRRHIRQSTTRTNGDCRRRCGIVHVVSQLSSVGTEVGIVEFYTPRLTAVLVAWRLRAKRVLSARQLQARGTLGDCGPVRPALAAKDTCIARPVHAARTAAFAAPAPSRM